MPDNRLPKQLLYGELVRGKRSVGGQKKRFKDSLKVAISYLEIPVHSWETLAVDVPAWPAALTKVSKMLKACRKKREVKKTRSESFNSTSPSTMNHVLFVEGRLQPGSALSATNGDTKLRQLDDVLVFFALRWTNIIFNF